ncbi:methyl-accepting chemotaxis protein [Marinomonas balearica]|uniref:Methyl-accepting chemotaxis protein n=1 Tax=Marinomonas balearica TaxID=491947 RepID=A0A4V3CFV6_9GAMM|nr:methyl-accepting chemotaxis protein [Marinomonas balearica]TDO95342.1 methyl-accepting chemotaxis protein [Marinomonas balearica]
MTIKNKLFGTLFILSVLILLIGSVSYFTLHSVNNENNILHEINTANREVSLARLAQEDYMIAEKEQFKIEFYEHVRNAKGIILNVQKQMDTHSNFSAIKTILDDIIEFEHSFDDFYDNKKSAILARKKFDNEAANISKSINAVLLSIAHHFAENRHDFEEFNRYKNAKFLKDHLNDIRVWVWKYNTKPTEKSADYIEKEISILAEQAETLQKTMLSENTKKLLVELNDSVLVYQHLFRETHKTNIKLSKVTSNMFLLASDISKTMRLLVESETAQLKVKSARQIFSMEAIVVVALLVALIMGYYLYTSIMTPLLKSIRFSKYIAEGDLTHTIDVVANDEFGSLNASLNQSAHSLSNMISNLKLLTSDIQQSSTSMTQSVANSKKSADNQLMETSAVAASANEMAAATHEISSNATQASGQAKSAEEQVEIGILKVNETLEAAGMLSKDMNKAADMAGKLEESSANIAEIIDVIRNIADQTNLLALNAAIEAARAGEQGRGFSVVADEVRSLASKTQDSVDQISNIITTIQAGSENVVHAVNTSQAGAKNVAELMEESEAVYNSIARSIDYVTQMSIQVSAASEQQVSVTNEINVNVQKISDLSGRSVDNLQSIEEEIQSQERQSNDLLTAINFFKLAEKS